MPYDCGGCLLLQRMSCDWVWIVLLPGSQLMTPHPKLNWSRSRPRPPRTQAHWNSRRWTWHWKESHKLIFEAWFFFSKFLLIKRRPVVYIVENKMSTVEAWFSGHRFSGKPRFKGHYSENLGFFGHFLFLLHKSAWNSGKSCFSGQKFGDWFFR